MKYSKIEYSVRLRASQRDAEYKRICKILFPSFALIFPRDILPNVFRRGNDFENRVASADRSTYPTLIPPSALSLSGGYKSNCALFPSLYLSLSLSFSLFLRDRITLLSTDKPRWKTWHSPGTTIYSIFAKLAESLPGKPTDQPDVLSFLASRERKMMEVAYGKKGRKERKREREKCALLARTDFLELLMARDSEKTRFYPPR